MYTSMLQQLLAMKGVAIMPTTSREIESRCSSETRVALNRGTARPYLSSWRHLCHIRRLDFPSRNSDNQVLNTGNTICSVDNSVGSQQLLAWCDRGQVTSLCITAEQICREHQPLYANNARPMCKEMLQVL